MVRQGLIAFILGAFNLKRDTLGTVFNNNKAMGRAKAVFDHPNAPHMAILLRKCDPLACKGG